MEILFRYGLIAVFLAIQPPISSFAPEEISLLYAGFLAGTGRHPLWLSLVVGWLAILSADTLTWLVGRKVGLHPEGFMARRIGAHRIERIDRFYRRYGSWTIVLCRQIPGLRLPTFFFAGAAAFPLGRFLRYDALGAMITAGVYVGLGAAFAEDFERLLVGAESFRQTLLSGVGILVAAVALGWLLRRLYARYTS